MPTEAAHRLHLAARRLAALELAERGLKDDPADAVCLRWRADLLRALDRPADAAARRAPDLGIDLAEACLDPFAEIGDARIESLALYLAQFDGGMADDRLEAAHRGWARRHADLLLRFDPAWRAGERLRIGYVSADLGRHPVGRLLLGTFARHDKAAVALHVYSDRLQEDEITAALQASTDAWTASAALSDEALAARIFEDGIDVLVDLAGHTWGSRLGTFARKPAPVQVSFLGYGAATGLAAMDSFVSDAWESPEDGMLEPPLRLPSGRLPLPARTPRADREGPLVYGSLNKLAKLSPAALALWCEVLRRAPQARVLMMTAGLEEDWVRDLVVEAFAEQGIGAERLDLRGPAPEGVHLAAYGEIDVMLDSSPFSGAMTTIDALCSGVPVVTLPRGRALSRQSGSLLARAGLGDFVATDEEEFVRIALAAPGRPVPAREADAGQAAELEAAFRQLWEKRLGSNPA
jgi:protein O-GlcNAc transferase